MSEKRHSSALGERHNEAAVSHAHQPSPRSSTRGRRTLWLVLILVLPGVVTIFALTLGGAAQWGRTSLLPSSSSPATGTHAASTTLTISSSVSVRAAKIHMYKVTPPDAGLMLPAVDRQGNVWFGEMASNRLARLDAHTGTITAWLPPGGEDGIMGTTLDAQGNVWFAEQNANYIGRFDPARQTFRTFSLGSRKDQRVGLQDLQFDASGKLWFTEMVAGRIGRLDPASGMIQSWAVPASSSGTPLYLFGLAVTQDGQIWFGTFSGGVVGHLDPTTGRFRLYHLLNPGEQIYSMAIDARGRIWFTELQFGKLGIIDTTTGNVTELHVPTKLGNPEDLHSIVVANGDIWFTSSGANALVRYSPHAGAYTFFHLPVPDSIPFGLTLSSAGTLWFTAGGNPVNYVGEMTIPS
jgi:virginiamycin B lyase